MTIFNYLETKKNTALTELLALYSFFVGIATLHSSSLVTVEAGSDLLPCRTKESE